MKNTNTNEYTNILRPGVYTEKKLVEIFGSLAQKKYFSEHGTLRSGSYFNNMMKNIHRYCIIEPMEERSSNGGYKFKVSSIYKYPLPHQFNKMNSGMYQYMLPLILSFLINFKDKKCTISLNPLKLARKIKMVNQNYDTVRGNKRKASLTLGLNYSYINEYCERLYLHIQYYINTSFDYLRITNCIVYLHKNKTYFIDIDRCNNLLLHFKAYASDNSTMINEFNKLFAKKVMNNALKRYQNKSSKFSYHSKEELESTYGILNDIVLNQNAEKLKLTSNHLNTSDVQVDFKKK